MMRSGGSMMLRARHCKPHNKLGGKMQGSPRRLPCICLARNYSVDNNYAILYDMSSLQVSFPQIKS